MSITSHVPDPCASPVPRMIGHEIYRTSSYGPHHPLRVPRVSTVMDLSRALGWLPPEQFVQSPRAKPAALLGFHTSDYIAALQSAERTQMASDETTSRHGLGTPSNPIFAEMFRRPATSAGGSLLAGEMLARGGVVYVPAGGTHHGMPDRANGFCYLNDPVLAILSLRRNGAQRIAYVDIDAHHPDGVEYAFAGDPDTLLVSTHEENRWPRTGAINDRGVGQVWNIPVPARVGDDVAALVREEIILPLIADFRPDAIVLQCGADALLEDPQSRMSWSNQAHWGVVAALKEMAPRYLVLGGGGYNPWSVGRCWTGVWAALNGFEVPDVLPETAQTILRNLEWRDQRRFKEPPAHWVNRLADDARPGAMPGAVRDRVATLKDRMRKWI